MSSSAKPLLGAIEGGGTKFVCAVGTGPDDVRARRWIATTTPVATLNDACAFLRQAAGGRLEAVGIACFGPLELDQGSPSFGSLLATPKPGWSDAPVAQVVRDQLGVQVAIDTDVNGAALGEWRWGAARDCDPALYLTVGTGIGGGAVFQGRPLHGLLHPEMGHIPLPRMRWPDGRLDDYPGCCPFHQDCFEGLASGFALEERMGVPADTLAADHPLWDLEAGYLAHALAAYVLVLSPERIVVGGGVMQQPGLLSRIQRRLPEVLAGYVKRPEVQSAVERFVVAPHFGQDAGLMGAFALAELALEPSSKSVPPGS